jgi:hypothetical protein
MLTASFEAKVLRGDADGEFFHVGIGFTITM